MPGCGELPRHLLRVGGIVPFFASLRGTLMPRLASAMAGRSQPKNENRKDVLTAGGRGPIEEGRMPGSRNRADFTPHQRCGSDSDNENPNDEHHKGQYRVHRNAKLAMIGVICNRMHMRCLGDGKKS